MSPCPHDSPADARAGGQRQPAVVAPAGRHGCRDRWWPRVVGLLQSACQPGGWHSLHGDWWATCRRVPSGCCLASCTI